jgi:SAM-dependent methyltransferase
VDISSAAIELARNRVPEAELDVAPVWEAPFEDGAFDLIVMNDVLQHVPEDHVAATLAEFRRLQAPGGTLLIRTGGALRHRRERDDWRAYDRRTLARTLEQGGYRCERVTYVNLLPSLWALARGHRPHAPTQSHHGVTQAATPGLQSSVASRWLSVEARYLGDPARSLPYGHTLLALASPAA